MKDYFSIIYLYFSHKSLLFLTFFTSCIILLPEVIYTLFFFINEEGAFFIYSNFIVTLIIEISGAVFGFQLNTLVSKKKTTLRQFFFTYWQILTFTIVSHVLLKIYKFIVLDSFFFKVNENTGLYPIFFLIIFQGLIYFLKASYIPIIIYAQKIKLSIKQYGEFIIKNFFSVIQDLTASCILAFISILTMAFIFSNIEKIINIFGNLEEIHTIIERFLEIFFKVSFNHFFILFLLQKNK